MRSLAAEVRLQPCERIGRTKRVTVGLAIRQFTNGSEARQIDDLVVVGSDYHIPNQNQPVLAVPVDDNRAASSKKRDGAPALQTGP
jgi:hypothetical protein